MSQVLLRMQTMLSQEWTGSTQQDGFRVWLENILRYESEASDITEHLKITTLVNELHTL